MLLYQIDGYRLPKSTKPSPTNPTISKHNRYHDLCHPIALYLATLSVTSCFFYGNLHFLIPPNEKEETSKTDNNNNKINKQRTNILWLLLTYDEKVIEESLDYGAIRAIRLLEVGIISNRQKTKIEKKKLKNTHTHTHNIYNE